MGKEDGCAMIQQQINLPNNRKFPFMDELKTKEEMVTDELKDENSGIVRMGEMVWIVCSSLQEVVVNIR